LGQFCCRFLIQNQQFPRDGLFLALRLHFQDIVVKTIGKATHAQGKVVVPGSRRALGLLDLAEGHSKDSQGHLGSVLGKAVGKSCLASGGRGIGVRGLGIEKFRRVNGGGAGEAWEAAG